MKESNYDKALIIGKGEGCNIQGFNVLVSQTFKISKLKF